MTINLYDYIEVTRPYFALDNLRIDTDSVCADIKAQQAMGNELGPIAAAEVGRHLAILGSCALAHDNPIRKKHFYIACKAELALVPEQLETLQDSQGILTGKGKTLEFNKRDGVARTEISAVDGQPIFTLETHYKIIKESIFKKLYQSKKSNYSSSSFNPYAIEHSFKNKDIKKDSITASFGPLTPEQCSGHFDSYPCIPVAILMHMLSKLAGLLLAEIVGIRDVKYVVKNAKISATTFAFAGDLVYVTSKLLEIEDGQYIFHCAANNNQDLEYGDMRLSLILAS